jgi:hypothetical protein
MAYPSAETKPVIMPTFVALMIAFFHSVFSVVNYLNRGSRFRVNRNPSGNEIDGR